MIAAVAMLALARRGEGQAAGIRPDTLLRTLADSQTALAALANDAFRPPPVAAKWHALGLYAWSLRDRARAKDVPRSLDATRLGRLADSALRIAVQLDPRNVAYRLDVGRFLIASGAAMSRAAAGGFFESALELARGSNDAGHAGAALEYGRVHWRRYDAYANRRMVTSIGDIGRSLSDAMQPVARVAAVLEELAQRSQTDEALMSAIQRGGQGGMPVNGGMSLEDLAKAKLSVSDIATAFASSGTSPTAAVPSLALKSVREEIELHSFALPAGVSGASDFARADSLFREAYATDPALPGAFRCVAMTLAERDRWQDLAAFAAAHVAKFPDDGTARMTLGLARHRLGKTREAEADFELGLNLLPRAERERLDDPARVLTTFGAERFASTVTRIQNARVEMFWKSGDPLWSDGIVERRAEFRARVTFAELRWTLEEAGIRGADTDRGDIYVRYGPPNLVAGFGPNMTENAADIMTFWMYQSGLMFAFTGMSGFGTSRIPLADRALVDATKESQPARWDNISLARVDSFPLRATRFRNVVNAAYVDVLFAADPPAAALLDSSPAARADLLVIAGDGKTVAHHDSASLRGHSRAGNLRAWSARLEGGEYLARLEVTGLERSHDARGAVVVDIGSTFDAVGPGLSDLLLARTAVPRTSDAPARWSDFVIDPAVAGASRQSGVALLWENYELGERDGAAQYEVTVTIERDMSGIGRIGASLAGAFAAIARVDRKPDRLTFSFPRTPPYRAVITDALPITLGDTPPGPYTVTLEINDLVLHKTFRRTGTLVVTQ
ncbi:MAG TPA: GWxTD domain-containing protein [Gemmatimonadaceae bacterium]|nr:GWxTD domain-containing protein [Gemmatimonadaceae bacterium]